MIKRLFGVLTVVILLAAPLGTALAYQSMYGPTEVVYLDEAKAEDGYVLFAAGGFTYLIDKRGRVCHSWPVGGFRLIDDGQMVCNPRGAGFQILDWDGNVTWSWTPPTDNPRLGRAHHDYEPIFDPVTGEMTILFVARYNVPYLEAIAAGADPDCDLDELDGEGNPNQAAADPDSVWEINMNGEIIWYWTIWDHVVQSYDPAGQLPSGRSTYQAAVEVNPDYLLDQRYRIQDFGRLDINMDDQRRDGLTGDWNHVNSMGYNPVRDEIVINSREHGEIYVIDHSLTTEEAATAAGDFVYRWGNPSNYGMGEPPTWRGNGHEQLWGAHNIHWIQEGYQGAGHFLIFENGSKRVGGPGPTISSSFEIDPYDENGNYVRQEDAGYTDTGFGNSYGNLSDQVVWKWSTMEVNRFQHGMYSAHISGTQRCKNGNTLIIAGEPANIVEVSPDGEVVWNYIMPIVSIGGGQYEAKTVHGPGDVPNLFRAYPIPKDDPRLAGKDLTPGDTLTGRLPGLISEGFQFPESVPITGWGIPPGTSSEAGAGAGAGGTEGGGAGGY